MIHLVARVLNRGFLVFEYHTDCPKYENQTLLYSIPQNYCKLLLQKEQQLELPTFSQDTKLSATGKLSKQDKHAN